MRKRDPELGNYIGTNCPQVAMTTSTGKKRKTLAATVEQLFRIIQSIPSPKAEPFKLWMAQVAESATAELHKEKNPHGYNASAKLAQAGGKAAEAARLNLEEQLGHSIVSREKATDYLPPADRWGELSDEKDEDEC